jgi:hypothetical protein
MSKYYIWDLPDLLMCNLNHNKKVESNKDFKKQCKVTRYSVEIFLILFFPAKGYYQTTALTLCDDLGQLSICTE